MLFSSICSLLFCLHRRTTALAQKKRAIAATVVPRYVPELNSSASFTEQQKLSSDEPQVLVPICSVVACGPNNGGLGTHVRRGNIINPFADDALQEVDVPPTEQVEIATQSLLDQGESVDSPE